MDSVDSNSKWSNFRSASVEIDRIYDLWIRSHAFDSEANFQSVKQEERKHAIDKLAEWIRRRKMGNSYGTDHMEDDTDSSHNISKELSEMIANLNSGFLSSKFFDDVMQLHKEVKQSHLDIANEILENKRRIDALLMEIQELENEHKRRLGIQMISSTGEE